MVVSVLVNSVPVGWGGTNVTVVSFVVNSETTGFVTVVLMGLSLDDAVRVDWDEEKMPVLDLAKVVGLLSLGEEEVPVVSSAEVAKMLSL
ncbi:gluconolactonase [Platysternon megacephalum]|uniref:Gluconolactonase n=1 Tax=Platysternon megacephalum TaxID=55544 RepID=A0A4D9DHW5_9SAUR|nr:gluconolactonase [Platysternon megacephalum]